MSNDIDIKENHSLPEDNLNLRSEEVQERLGRPPRGSVRVGRSSSFGVVAGLFVGSSFL